MVIKSELQAKKEIVKRVQLGSYALESVENLALIKSLCSKDIFFWLEYFCFTYDPRKKCVYNIPFIPYDFQRDLILEIVDSIRSGHDLIIEKSRDMGATWCALYALQWYWQFHSGYNFHLGSKKKDNVDIIGDLSTLFGKLRYNISLQPQWLLPDRFSTDKHMPALKISSPENGNSITGESSNKNFSRSGRYSAILFDEFAFWNYDEEAWAAAGDSTPCRIAISTPYGKFNKFADIRFNTDIKVITLHWKLHPFKSLDWYNKEKLRRTKDEIARELDINYIFSVEGKVYKDFDYPVHVRQNITLDKTLPLIRAWDFGLNPAVVFSQIDKNGQWRIIDEIVPDLDVKPTISQFIPDVIAYCNKHYNEYRFEDVCDIAGRQRSSHTGKTDIDWLTSFGVYPRTNFVKIEEGINLVASKMIVKTADQEPCFLVSQDCTTVIEALNGGYKRKKPVCKGQETPPDQEHPYEDVMDCIRYTAWEYFDPLRDNRKKRRKVRRQPDNTSTGY